VLFSEPKIPQFARLGKDGADRGWFQCSSASRKFLNVQPGDDSIRQNAVSVLFSEPKIPQSRVADQPARRPAEFQCSSASRKFLNSLLPPTYASPLGVSVLFSEPKIPQLNIGDEFDHRFQVSVLFSEPKIPQLSDAVKPELLQRGFSALQRAENSSIMIRKGVIF